MKRILIASVVFVALVACVAPALAAPNQQPTPVAVTCTWQGSGVTSANPQPDTVNSDIIGAKVKFRGWGTDEGDLSPWGDGGGTFQQISGPGGAIMVSLDQGWIEQVVVDASRSTFIYYGQTGVTSEGITTLGNDFRLTIDETVPSILLQVEDGTMIGRYTWTWYVSGKDLKGKIRVT